jgi:hypothetical protein
MPRAPALHSFPPNDTLTGSPLRTAQKYFYYSRRNGTGDGVRCTQPLIAQFRRRSILIGGTRKAPNACDPSTSMLRPPRANTTMLPPIPEHTTSQHQNILSLSTATACAELLFTHAFSRSDYGAWRHILSRSVEVAYPVLFSFNGNKQPALQNVNLGLSRHSSEHSQLRSQDGGVTPQLITSVIAHTLPCDYTR